MSGLRGNLYEKCVLDNLSRTNGPVPCFTMSKDCANTALFSREFCFTAPGIPHKYFKTLEEIEVDEEGPRPCLWIPIQSNYKSFDGLLLLPDDEALWLQVTVGVDHPSNSVSRALVGRRK